MNNIENTIMNNIENTIMIKSKINALKHTHPTLSKLWLNYFTKHNLLYNKVLNEVNIFLDNVNNFNNVDKNTILILYLILNNDINITD
jgi:hypothetical protein